LQIKQVWSRLWLRVTEFTAGKLQSWEIFNFVLENCDEFMARRSSLEHRMQTTVGYLLSDTL
jgi:hypothetical protein